MCNGYCVVRVFGKRSSLACAHVCASVCARARGCACVSVRECVSDCVCIDCQWLNPRLADTGSVPDVNSR
jgi:hypothetical protein